MTDQAAPANGNTHALAPVAPGSLAKTEFPDPQTFIVPGMEDTRPDELRLPRLSLVQAQSRMAGAQDHLGLWHNTITGEFTANPELLIIGVARGRVMFPQDFSADNKPLCGSDDGGHPRDEYIGQEIKRVFTVDGEPSIQRHTITPACAQCPFAKWGDDGQPPACNEVATFAGISDEGLPSLFQLRSSAMKNAPNLKTLIAANGLRRAIRLGAVKETNDSGAYYVPQFSTGAKPNKDWQNTALRLATLGNLAARNQRAAMEQEQTDHMESDEFDEFDDYKNAEPGGDNDIPF